MAQSLLIGLGGTGSRVVNEVARELTKNGKSFNDGLGQICLAVLDSNTNDNKSIIESKTGVPVYEISKPKKIEGYLNDYNHLDMLRWCPDSPSFRKESMTDGCSEIRVKSRIAFMDCYESGVTRDLQMKLNEILKFNDKSKIRIMVVSSLCGGTGSGMFIQMALWLRQILAQSEISIRGIFLMPDIFIENLEDIRKNPSTQVRHYANAYAAIRELNTITKLRKETGSLKLSERIVLDKLFDSKSNVGKGSPVYDFAFFVDNQDENGIRLNSMAEYERMVAQLVYMQLYAPMESEMKSEEDNTYDKYRSSPEPLYGSCGTSKAVYPVESVKMYCTIRATQDSLSGSWRRIDDEVDALKEERERNESTYGFDTRYEYVKFFEEKVHEDPDKAGSDHFLISLVDDIRNTKLEKGSDNQMHKVHTDRIGDFVSAIKTSLIDTSVHAHGGYHTIKLDSGTFLKNTNDSVEKMLALVKNKDLAIERAVKDFTDHAKEYAREVVNKVFTYSMGDVKASNAESVYGLFSRVNEDGERLFIHPVSARYLLYKLYAALKDMKNRCNPESAKATALKKEVSNSDIDYPWSFTKTEKSPTEYLMSRKKVHPEQDFVMGFKKKYLPYLTKRVDLVETYEKEFLQQLVYEELMSRVKDLYEQFEAFFKTLPDTRDALNNKLEENVIADQDDKVIYVFSKRKDREGVYQSLDLKLDSSDSAINQSVINAAYGIVCANARPKNELNMPYANYSIASGFVRESMKTFRERIENDEQNAANVEMDIYTAICKESDIAAMEEEDENKKKNKLKNNMLDDIDFKTGKQIDTGVSVRERHRVAFKSYKDRLFSKAAPYLVLSPEPTQGKFGSRTMHPKTFWGFHPRLTQAYNGVGAELGTNEEIAQKDAYPFNELYCYRAVYGLKAVYIPKFVETEDGVYYAAYREIVDKMIADCENDGNEYALASTPHLDKYWHKYLPYITPDMQQQGDTDFSLGILLALAYGQLKLDKQGCFVIRRAIDTGFGTPVNKDVPILYKDKPVKSTDVKGLIDALKKDEVFSNIDIPALKKKYEKDLDDLVTYEGTDVFKGLTGRGEDFKPVTVIIRYNEALGHDFYITAGLIGALEKIASDLAEHYNMVRSDEQIEKAKFRICRRFYDSSKRIAGRENLFDVWEEKFKEFDIRKEAPKSSSPKSASGSGSADKK